MIGILPEQIINLGVLGFMIILAVCLVLVMIYKYIGIITFPIMLIVGLDYWDYYSSGNSELIWLAILSWLSIPFLIFLTVKRSG